MPELKINCGCKSYCLTNDMSIPKDFHTIYEILENCFVGIKEDDHKLVELEKSLDTCTTDVSCNHLLDSMKKYLKRKALSMYVIGIILKYEKCSYISRAMSKDTPLGARYLSLKKRYSDVLVQVMSCSVEQLKAKFTALIH